MIGILLLLVALAVSLSLGLLAQDDPGYVLISRWPYEIEISLALLGAALTVTGVVAYFLVRLILRIFRSPRDLRTWRARRRNVLADQAMLAGYARLIEGEWEDAEMSLIDGLGAGSAPLLQYLGAAYAAQQRGDFESRDRYLLEARSQDPERVEAIEITRARLLERAGQIDEARGVLEDLHEKGKRPRAVQRMLIELMRQQNDWTALEKFVRENKQLRELPKTEIDELRRETQIHRLSDQGEPTAVWERLTRRQRKDPALQSAYAQSLLNQGENKEAERFLRKCITRHWDGELVRLYGYVRSERMDEQLNYAEKWALSHEDDPDLLMTLARLNLENKHREKARDCLLKAVRLGGTREGYLEIGLLLESMGESDKALQCYRRGLQVKDSPLLPKENDKDQLRYGELVPVANDPKNLT